MAETNEKKVHTSAELPPEGGTFSTPETAPETESPATALGDTNELAGFQPEKISPAIGDVSPKQVEPFGGRPPMVEAAKARMNLNEFMRHLSDNLTVATSDEAAALQQEVNDLSGRVPEDEPKLE